MAEAAKQLMEQVAEPPTSVSSHEKSLETKNLLDSSPPNIVVTADKSADEPVKGIAAAAAPAPAAAAATGTTASSDSEDVLSSNPFDSGADLFGGSLLELSADDSGGGGGVENFFAEEEEDGIAGVFDLQPVTAEDEAATMLAAAYRGYRQRTQIAVAASEDGGGGRGGGAATSTTEHAPQFYTAGTKVECRFGGLDEFYPGVIEKFDEASKLYDIVYDDGDRERGG